MILTESRIIDVKIPFKFNFKHALATRTQSSSVIVELTTEDGTCGYGEATPREYVTGESIAATVVRLKTIMEQLNGLELKRDQDILEQITTIKADLSNELAHAPAAGCALELGLLDLFGKLRQKPASAFFGPPRKQVIFYSGVISDVSLEETQSLLELMKAFRFGQIKLKVAKDCSIAIKKIELIRSLLGGDTQIRVDANEAWELPEAIENSRRLGRHGVKIIEQPMPAKRREDYPRLMEKIDRDTQIMIDEGLCTIADAEWFVRSKAANGFNLKISKVGGLTNAFTIYELAQTNGIACQLGCHVGETSLLTAAGQTFAALAEDLVAFEGAFGSYLLEWDIVEDPLQFDENGRFDLRRTKEGAGLGLTINPALLAKAAAQIVPFPNKVI
jgi:L-alanine-DL-glutamate epimerase-like enolase superfamily enzyme